MSFKLVNVRLVETCLDEKIDAVNEMLASSGHNFSFDYLFGYKQAALDIRKLLTDVGLLKPDDMDD